MKRFGRMARLPWTFWLMGVLCVGYCVAIVMGVPFVAALPMLIVAQVVALYGVPEDLMAPRIRRYALAGTVLIAGMVYVGAGGDVAAGVGTLSFALATVTYVILGVGLWTRWNSSRTRHRGTRA